MSVDVSVSCCFCSFLWITHCNFQLVWFPLLFCFLLQMSISKDIILFLSSVSGLYLFAFTLPSQIYFYFLFILVSSVFTHFYHFLSFVVKLSSHISFFYLIFSKLFFYHSHFPVCTCCSFLIVPLLQMEALQSSVESLLSCPVLPPLLPPPPPPLSPPVFRWRSSQSVSRLFLCAWSNHVAARFL